MCDRGIGPLCGRASAGETRVPRRMLGSISRDESFDLVITQDFFEHVLRPAKEIARTLKSGGAHIYAVPYDRWKNGRPSRS